MLVFIFSLFFQQFASFMTGYVCTPEQDHRDSLVVVLVGNKRKLPPYMIIPNSSFFHCTQPLFILKNNKNLL